MFSRKILQINSVVNFRSTGTIVEYIGREALAHGWESYIAWGRIARPSESNLIRIGNTLNVICQGVETRFFDRHALGSKRATEKLIEQIRNIKPDIIHLHNIHDYYINIEVLFNYIGSANIPIVWTLHDCWPVTGHCAHFEFIGCDKWKTNCHHCPQKKEYPASLFLDRSRKNYQLKKELFTSVKNMTIVPVSLWLDSVVKDSYLSKYPVRVINNGVDLNLFHPKKDTQKTKVKYNLGDKFILLAVASAWIEKKGLYEYLKLSKLLKDDEILVMVGQIRDKINLPANIINVKRIEDLNELAELYTVANVIMNLSFQETFGLTTVEGFSCGTPSIVYNCTASPELIVANTGFVVSPGDFISIRAALDTIKLNKKEYYSVNCRTRAVDFYNKNDRYNEYVNLYEDLLNIKSLIEK